MIVVVALAIVAILIVALVDPELAEVYFGDAQILVATATLAAIVVGMLVSNRLDVLNALSRLGG
jgi:hypothetical protein